MTGVEQIRTNHARPRHPARQRQCFSAIAAAFCVGLTFGVATTVLSARETTVVALFLVVAGLTVVVLRRLAERSDEQILAGDFSYREFFDNAVEGIFRTTPSGHYLDVNPALARIYGYDTPDDLKQSLTDISSQLYVDPHRRDDFKAVMQQHDEVRDFVSEIRRRDGTSIWIKENARAVRDWSGKLVCYQGTVEDVTVRFEAERAIKKGLERAEEANRTKDAFLAMISHELKTPLNAIIGFSEMIRRETLGPIGNRAYVGYVEDILASGTKLLAIINDVLDVARLEGAAIDLNRSDCSASQIVAIALERARALTADERSVLIDVPDSMPRLNVDKNRLAQVLANLLSNALKFTPAAGQVSLAAKLSPDGVVRFAVSDTGIGMSPEAIALALQPFHQADASLARKFEGAGLGLPIARALAELHGGSLSIVSREGRGTTVTVELPAACVCQDGLESRVAAR